MSNDETETTLEELLKKETELQLQLSMIQHELQKIKQRCKKLLEFEPVCSSCGRHVRKKNMWIATQDDLDGYYSENEGYGGPTIGEYYCGC